jgi:hypothetical protein
MRHSNPDGWMAARRGTSAGPAMDATSGSKRSSIQSTGRMVLKLQQPPRIGISCKLSVAAYLIRSKRVEYLIDIADNVNLMCVVGVWGFQGLAPACCCQNFALLPSTHRMHSSPSVQFPPNPLEAPPDRCAALAKRNLDGAGANLADDALYMRRRRREDCSLISR